MYRNICSHPILCMSQSQVQTTRTIQEADALVFVASDAAQNNIILLSSLESIDTGHLDILIQLLLERPVKLRIVDNIGTLTLVWCDHADLVGHDARLEILGNNLLDVGCFHPGIDDKQVQMMTWKVPVEERSSTGGYFLLTKILVE
jgi:hypothetical protein